MPEPYRIRRRAAVSLALDAFGAAALFALAFFRAFDAGRLHEPIRLIFPLAIGVLGMRVAGRALEGWRLVRKGWI